MKMKGRKVTVFFVMHITLLGFLLLIVLKAPGTVGTMAPVLLNTMMFNAVLFVGGVLAKDFIKSKWYVAALDGKDG